jgi:glycosyltransferase involved in cell wall biosynthesis
MNVTVTVHGRFHAFDLAAQLEKRGQLARLITTYPRYKARPWHLPAQRILSLPQYEVGKRVARRLAAPVGRSVFADSLMSRAFDWHAARHLPRGTDVVVSFAGAALHTIRQAHRQGAITVVERGSSHIATQYELLREEGRRWNLPPPELSDDHLRRELQEYAETDFIGIPSAFVRRTFVERGIPESRLIQAAYGVDLSHFRPAEKPHEGPFRVIFCGAVSLRKGVPYLLQAFCELNLPGSELWIIGNVLDELRPFLDRWKHPGIRLCGAHPQNELYRLYQQGSVFVLPSIEEGFGMVLPQAMACGLPVICTPNGAGEDLVEEGREGFIVPIRDVPALKERLAVLASDSALRGRMSAAALARVKSGFTWDDYGDRIMSGYSRALEEQRSRRN